MAIGPRGPQVHLVPWARSATFGSASEHGNRSFRNSRALSKSFSFSSRSCPEGEDREKCTKMLVHSENFRQRRIVLTFSTIERKGRGAELSENILTFVLKLQDPTVRAFWTETLRWCSGRWHSPGLARASGAALIESFGLEREHGSGIFRNCTNFCTNSVAFWSRSSTDQPKRTGLY